MKSTQFKNRVGGLLLAFSVLIGIVLVSSSSVQAQWRRNDDDRRDRRSRDYRRERNRDYQRNDRYRNNRRNEVYRNDGYYGRGGYGNNGNAYQMAQRQGYQQGIYTGGSDAQRRQSYNPQRSRYFKNPPNNSGYQFDQAYRSGFLQGYREGYQRYGGYYGNRGNNGGFRLPW